MRILLVEDDAVLGNATSIYLRSSDYIVDWARDGRQADSALSEEVYDAVVLDLGLPKIDGLTVLKRLRARKLDTRVIILTARDDLEDRIAGLDLGADDYLVKPVRLAELAARLRAQLRRKHDVLASTIEYPPLTLHIKERLVTYQNQPFALSPRELSIFETLLLRVGKVVSKEGLIENISDWDDSLGKNAIEVYIHRLRKKLLGVGIEVRTLRGLGYMLDKQA
ncbi:transcriptional regulatory protein QseB [mine drainage metagenome]|uniref:Transcriptional regulatory protein QseB n=1 Tax=mine drainage metagenome TaxID=410659 RepID=A0A1J5SKF3_9ZZZZ